jgi:uncharacterized protein (DUF58 family)
MVLLPTRRLLGLALLAAPLLVAASLEPWLLYVTALYLTALMAVIVLDLYLAPPASAFRVERHFEQHLSLGEQNPVDLLVVWKDPHRVPAGRPLHILARDEAPAGITADAQLFVGTISPRGEWSGRYHLQPVRRGDYRFGDVHLRVQTPFGLMIRQHRYPMRAAVQVYPNMRAVRRYELLARRGRLQEAGLRHARLVGAGTEFERLRDYQPDDDYRRIAWKATARRRQPVTVEYETERSQNLILLLDTGRLMGTPIGPMQKLDYAVNAALMLAYMAAQMEDRVGLLAFSDRVELFVPPRRGRRQFHLLLESLYKVNSQPVESDPAMALAFLASRQQRRSLMVLFTDVEEATEAAALVGPLTVLSRHHLPLCVTVSDPDLNRLAAVVPANSRESYEKVVAQRLLDERSIVLEHLERRGTLSLDVPAEQLTVAVVNRYLEIKARTRL